MKRLLVLLTASFAVIALLMGGLAPQAHAAGRFKPKAEQQSTLFSSVSNMKGAKARFAWKVPGRTKKKTLIECDSVPSCPNKYAKDYKKWSSNGWTDRPHKFKVLTDEREVLVTGFGIADGYYTITGANVGKYHRFDHINTNIWIYQVGYAESIGKSIKGELPISW